jgi:hypothetical protein
MKIKSVRKDENATSRLGPKCRTNLHHKSNVNRTEIVNVFGCSNKKATVQKSEEQYVNSGRNSHLLNGNDNHSKTTEKPIPAQESAREHLNYFVKAMIIPADSKFTRSQSLWASQRSEYPRDNLLSYGRFRLSRNIRDSPRLNRLI